VINRKNCTVCGQCVYQCPTKALSVAGKTYSIPDLISELLEDSSYYNQTGGGVTFSGGEPLSQSEFLIDLAKELHDECIDTTLETSGYCEPHTFMRTIEHIDRIFFDLKTMNSIKHKEYTGVDNSLILKNLEYSTRTKPTTIRIPLIPSVNMDDSSSNEFISIIKDLPVVEVHLLPYHSLGIKKNESIGRKGWETSSSGDERYYEIQNKFMNQLSIPVKLFPIWK